MRPGDWLADLPEGGAGTASLSRHGTSAAGAAPPALRLRRLALAQFRNYAALTWTPHGAMAVLSGPNGSGKTNLLEAISLLAPGRGLRRARLPELARRGAGADGRWAVAARLDTPAGQAEIGTGTPPEGTADRRVLRLDGAAPRSQAVLATRLAVVWLTPQMDRLFLEGAGGRRRFLDRLVYAFDPDHARQVAAYETALAGRRRLLDAGTAEAAWLAGIEDALARHAVAVCAARLALAARLNAALMAEAAAPFPPARLAVQGTLAERLAHSPALAAEQWLRDALAASRRHDGAARAALHADMLLADAETGITAAEASTGQQKALLLGVVLGHAALLTATRGAGPLLLLDEPAVHLDADRRAALFATLQRLPVQAFLTGTDAETFAPLRGVAEAWRVAGGELYADPDFPPPEPLGTVF